MMVEIPLWYEYANLFGGADITMQSVANLMLHYNCSTYEIDASNFSSVPLKLSDDLIIQIKTEKEALFKRVTEINYNLSEEEWHNKFGYKSSDVQVVSKLGVHLKHEEYLKLTTSQQNAYINLIMGIHVGMQAVPEKYYNIEEVFRLAVEKNLDRTTYGWQCV